MADDLKKHLKQVTAKQDATSFKPILKPRKVSDQNDVLTQFGKPFLDRNQGEVKLYKEKDLRHKMMAFGNYLDRDGKSPVGSLIADPIKSLAKVTRPSQYLNKIRTESDILPAFGEFAMDAASVAGGAYENVGIGLKAIGKINHPLAKTLEPAFRNGLKKEWLTSATMASANKLAPVINKVPIARKVYKDVAFEIATQGSSANRDIEDVKKVLFGKFFGRDKEGYEFRKKTSSYDGTTLYEPQNPTKRSLLKNYIYGNETGFEPTDIQSTGLDKYTDMYGPMKSFAMKVENNDPADYMNLKDRLVSKYMDEAGSKSSATMAEGAKTYMDPERFRQGLNKYMDRNGVDEINFGVEGAQHLSISDDVAGHMGYIKRQPSGEFTYRSQDIWKFTPEDYNKKWNRFNEPHSYANDYPEDAHKYVKEDTRIMLDNYTRRKQAGLMDKAGKPFILQDERPISFTDNRPPVSPARLHPEDIANSGLEDYGPDDFNFDPNDFDLDLDGSTIPVGTKFKAIVNKMK